MSKAIQVVISNSNDMTAPVPNSEQTPSLLELVRAEYPNITDLERYVLFKHLEAPQENSGGQPHCAQDFKRTQISQPAQRYLEHLKAKDLDEKRKTAKPFMYRVVGASCDNNIH